VYVSVYTDSTLQREEEIGIMMKTDLTTEKARKGEEAADLLRLLEGRDNSDASSCVCIYRHTHELLAFERAHVALS